MRLWRSIIALIAPWFLWLQACLPDGAIAAERYLHVVYTPPTLTVEAEGVTLHEVLREIGLKVGFTVVDDNVPRLMLHISFADRPLLESLRQLLKGENYVFISRRQRQDQTIVGAGIEKVVLLGPKSSPTVTSESRDRENVQPTQVSDLHQGPASLPPSPTAISSTASLPSFPDNWGRTYNGHTDQPASATNLEELLTTHALAIQQQLEDSGAERGSSAIHYQLKRPGESSSETIGRGTSFLASPEIDEVLTITTQIAQHNLQVLIGGLTGATESLRDSLEQQKQ
jgi:hypothetical protein